MVCFLTSREKPQTKTTNKFFISPRPINSPAACKFITKFVVHSLPKGFKACGGFEGSRSRFHLSWLPPNVSCRNVPPNLEGLMKTHWFPLRPAMKPLFLKGGYVRGGMVGFTSQKNSSPKPSKGWTIWKAPCVNFKKLQDECWVPCSFLCLGGVDLNPLGFQTPCEEVFRPPKHT